MLLPLRFPRFWLLGGISIMALVLLLTLAPLGRVAAISFLNDKQAHFIAFAVLMLWFCGVFRLPFTPLVALGLVAFGGLIEWLQSHLPYRSAEFADLLFDGGGILAGWALALVGLRQWTAWCEATLSARRKA